MKRIIAVVSLIVFASLYQQTTARIGETPEQCQARYGKPVKIDAENKSIWYQKVGFLIAVTFYEGKAESIMFMKADSIDSVISGLAAEISETEIQNLLKSNGEGKKWREHFVSKETKSSGYMDKLWVTEDQERMAWYNAIKQLVIATKSASVRKAAKDEAEARKKEAEERKKLEGF